MTASLAQAANRLQVTVQFKRGNKIVKPATWMWLAVIASRALAIYRPRLSKP